MSATRPCRKLLVANGLQASDNPLKGLAASATTCSGAVTGPAPNSPFTPGTVMVVPTLIGWTMAWLTALAPAVSPRAAEPGDPTVR